MKSAEEYIRSAGKMPPAPKMISELLSLLGEESVDISRVVELISVEPALTTKILQDCNSVAVGLRVRVDDLSEAVMRLGYNDIYRRVVAIVGQGILSPQKSGHGLGIGALWEHSAASAISGKVLAQNLGLNESQIFTASLLHDIGKTVLSKSLEETYDTVAGRVAHRGCSWVEAERELFDTDHCEVGALVLEHWKFPASVVTAVRHHHDPARAQSYEQLAALVHLADVMAHAIGFGCGSEVSTLGPEPEALQILELTLKDIEAAMTEAESAVKKSSWLKLSHKPVTVSTAAPRPSRPFLFPTPKPASAWKDRPEVHPA